MARNFQINDQCTDCGACYAPGACPNNNITFDTNLGRPQIGTNCVPNCDICYEKCKEAQAIIPVDPQEPPIGGN